VNSRTKFAAPTQAGGLTRSYFVNEIASEMAIGATLNTRKPSSHGEMNAYPASVSRRRSAWRRARGPAPRERTLRPTLGGAPAAERAAGTLGHSATDTRYLASRSDHCWYKACAAASGVRRPKRTSWVTFS
jgi:hypothetical protein